MRTRPGFEAINTDRRQFLSTAAMGIAAAGAASLFAPQIASAATSDAIRAFRIEIPEDDLVDLRRRLVATRWPEKE
ncbi:MAG: twin-arginine translocation signal domain-containing protein, partial [Roseiarcus sp.]